MRIVFALAFCTLIAGCAADEVTWYRLVSFETSPAMDREVEEVLGGWLEVYPDSTALFRWEVVPTSEGGDLESALWVLRTPFEIIPFPNGPDSVRGAFGNNQFEGTLSDGVLTITEEEPLTQVYEKSAGGHPEILRIFELATLNGNRPPTQRSGGLVDAGRFQWYSDDTFVFTWDEGGSGAGAIVWLPHIAIAGAIEVAGETEGETQLGLVVDPSNEVESMNAVLSDSVLTVVYDQDTWVFHERR